MEHPSVGVKALYDLVQVLRQELQALPPPYHAPIMVAVRLRRHHQAHLLGQSPGLLLLPER